MEKDQFYVFADDEYEPEIESLNYYTKNYILKYILSSKKFKNKKDGSIYPCNNDHHDWFFITKNKILYDIWDGEARDIDQQHIYIIDVLSIKQEYYHDIEITFTI